MTNVNHTNGNHLKCISSHKNAMSLADQKMVTMAETVLASFVAQVRGVAFYSCQRVETWLEIAWNLQGGLTIHTTAIAHLLVSFPGHSSPESCGLVHTHCLHMHKIFPRFLWDS